MRFSRHAKQRLKLYGVSQVEARRIARWGQKDGVDRRGNPRYVAHVGGVRIRVVVARDDPDFIVTVHDRRR